MVPFEFRRPISTDEIPGKIEEVGISSFYIHRGFYAATRPPGALRRPGSPSQAL